MVTPTKFDRPLSYDPVLDEPWPDHSDEFEAYLDMTPEEQAREDARQDAEMDNLAREAFELDRQMTPLQRYRYRRHTWLRLALSARRHAREWDMQFLRDRVKELQKSLVRVRHQYLTGHDMGGVQ